MLPLKKLISDSNVIPKFRSFFLKKNFLIRFKIKVLVLEIELVEYFMGFVCRIVGKWYMNGLGSAGVAKGLGLLAAIIKEGKRLFANVYLALELVISSFSYLRCEVKIKFQFGRVSGFPYDFNYDIT